jgi:hypothetical protein
VKRIIFYFLIGVFLITSVTACSSQDSIPDGMSEKTYSIAKQVLEITNDLLDDKLTSDEAYSEIKELYDELQQNMSNDSDSSSYDSLVKTAIESILSNVKSLDGSNAANLSTHAISLGKDLLEQYLGISSN